MHCSCDGFVDEPIDRFFFAAGQYYQGTVFGRLFRTEHGRIDKANPLVG